MQDIKNERLSVSYQFGIAFVLILDKLIVPSGNINEITKHNM